MGKCKPGECDVGISKEFESLTSEPDAIWEVDLKTEGSNVLNEITRFVFCPHCGHKINWNRITKAIELYFAGLESTKG